MGSKWYLLCLYVYGFQQYYQINYSWPSYFLFCSVLYFKKEYIEKKDVGAVFNHGS